VLTIPLPPRVSAHELPSFVELLGWGNTQGKVALDFDGVMFLTPGAIAALVTKVHRWLNDGKKVVFTNHPRCSAFQYLQRINVFKECGIPAPESFRRRDPSGRFVELAKIGGDGPSIESLSTEAACCIAPDLASAEVDVSGPFDCVQYSISEMISNVRQHSGRYGFITAQYLPHNDFTRLAIADCGRGILESFRETASPHWYDQMDDVAAIRTALRPRVSSRSHMSGGWGDSANPVNAGVGLTLLRELASIVGGDFLVLSGNGAATLQTCGQFADSSRFYQGVVCEMGFPRAKVTNFFTLLSEAKQRVGLLTDGQYGARFV
jgi:hypothetical protein